MSDDGVARRYRRLATEAARGRQPVDCSGAFGASLYTSAQLEALPETAASFGCGNPTAVLDLRPGDRVLDLGSGAGADLILSARRVGPTGKVYGLDMLEEMLALARVNCDKAGVRTVELLKGRIEDVPLPAASVDAVVSNCVLSLSSDRAAVLQEIHRVLVPGGRVGISDIVAADGMTPDQRWDAMAALACGSHPHSAAEYREALAAAGFVDVRVTVTHEVADGLSAALIQARTPGTDCALMPHLID